MLPAIEIFKTGIHTAFSGEALPFDLAALRQIADGYNAEVHPAPLVIGHPELDDPAYGQVKTLKVEGDRLVAEVDQVEPRFAELVKAGRYIRISASLFKPDAVSNPTPGKWALRHVGFLGAAAPAIPGLKPVKFAAGDAGIVEFAAPAAVTTRETTVNEKEAAEFAERQRKLTESEAEIAAKAKKLSDDTAAFAAQQAATRRAADDAFLGDLVKAGRLPPAWRGGLLDFMARLDHADAVQFGEGAEGKATPRDFLKKFLGGLPVVIDLQERARAETVAGDAPAFAAPAGARVDPARDELHRKALAYQQAHKGTSYLDAIKAVGGR
jgi:hypothetical protein